MIRQHEKDVVWQAGVFTALVHGLLLALFLVSFQWKTVQPMNIAQVELWDSVPSPKADPILAPPPEPAPEPETPKAEMPKVVEPAKPEPKVAPEPEPKADIQTKKAPAPPPKVEKPKPEPVKPKEEKPKELPKVDKAKTNPEALKKLQQSLLAEDAQSQKNDLVKPAASAMGSKTAQVAQAGSPNAGELDKYKGLISNKIKQHVNKQLCGADKSIKVTFMIALMPTGEVMGRPKLIKESGMSSCDDAVERAILESQPLPVPSSADLFSQFRELNLVFRPNDTN
jgi:colicin import membrane protein